MNDNILFEIAASVSKRLQLRKALVSEVELLAKIPYARKPHPVISEFQKPGIHAIAEIKFRSPAVGALGQSGEALALKIAGEYLKAGATVLSVLTEQDHFQGQLDYLKAIRCAHSDAILLMKDFILEEYQIIEARLLGADMVLLIVALLGAEKCKLLLSFAKSLGLSALIEVHDEDELKQAIEMNAQLIGVNNRSLRTLEVSLENSFRMASQSVKGRVFVSESGITSSEELRKLSALGYQGFLIGSALMSDPEPGLRLAQLLREAK